MKADVDECLPYLGTGGRAVASSSLQLVISQRWIVVLAGRMRRSLNQRQACFGLPG
jgi:hypothetical protein